MYLDKGLRGQGIGRKLMDKAVSAAKELGYKSIVLDSMSKYKDARRLYERAGFKDTERYNDNLHCMPVEVMARRGQDTLRYGPLKPVGLRNPRTGREDYAVVQLRKDNADGTLYNMVGFQTHLKWGEQRRVFSLIPALRNAEFVRYPSDLK